ncbi:MAG: hypothetical protein WA208_10655 [Thermoanaerobaculia bacterium]
MLPGIYDFTWDAGHIIFLGAFYTVLMIVFATLLIGAARALRAMQLNKAEAVRWHADFEDLPATARRCRHELSGEVATRRCENGFDCRKCTEHQKFVAARLAMPALAASPVDEMVAGFKVPSDRLYHRGHTWVREDEGLLTVGIDDLGAHLIGTPDGTVFPAVGTQVRANATAWTIRKKGAWIRVLSPVDGEVVEVGDPANGWYLKVRPTSDEPDFAHLLTPEEARPWMLREAERLQMSLSADGVGAALADGGTPVDDLSVMIPRDQFDDVCGMMFLHP